MNSDNTVLPHCAFQTLSCPQWGISRAQNKLNRSCLWGAAAFPILKELRTADYRAERTESCGMTSCQVYEEEGHRPCYSWGDVRPAGWDWSTDCPHTSCMGVRETRGKCGRVQQWYYTEHPFNGSHALSHLRVKGQQYHREVLYVSDQHSNRRKSQEPVREQIKQVVGELEEVLGGLKKVQLEMKEQVLGDKLKNMTGANDAGDNDTGGKETAASKGMNREEFEEFQKQLIEEKIARDKEFTTRKAERANLRVQLRDKYRLPQSAQDDATVQMAGEDLELPEELAKMVEEDEEQEEINQSFLVKLQNMEVDFDTLKTKAQKTMSEVKQGAQEKCVMM